MCYINTLALPYCNTAEIVLQLYYSKTALVLQYITQLKYNLILPKCNTNKMLYSNTEMQPENSE